MSTQNKITKAYIRDYSDNGQRTAYIEWSNGGRTIYEEAVRVISSSPCRTDSGLSEGAKWAG